MIEYEYGVFFAKVGTTERHHLHKNVEPKWAMRDAWQLVTQMQRGAGTLHRLHSAWSTGVEVWETHPGDHEHLTAPDRLVARALWVDQTLTVTAADLAAPAVLDYLAECRVPFTVQES